MSTDNRTAEVVARLQAALDEWDAAENGRQETRAMDRLMEAAHPAAIQTILTALREQEERIQKLTDAVGLVFDAGEWGIYHVGKANYQDRENEAIHKLNRAYRAALNTKEQNHDRT